MSAPVTSVAICGSGFAAWMTALALRKGLDADVTITVVGPDAPPVEDNLYGHALPPESYSFHLDLGITEPELMLSTATTFAFGTAVMDWGKPGRSWVQAFAQPLPIWDGVPMARLVAMQSEASLQDVLIGAQAVRRGAFAHPPEDPANPLSRAEYGYSFAPEQLAGLYKHHATRAGVKAVDADIKDVEDVEGRIRTLRLGDGETLRADLFIDAGGLPSDELNDSALHATVSHDPAAKPGPPARVVKAREDGWESEILLQNGARRLSVSTTPYESSIPLDLGSSEAPWEGNRIAVGRAAARLDPFTTAPIKLLLRDITRLLGLFPVATDMRIEARAYNTDFRADRDHAELFTAAHFKLDDLPDTHYWQRPRAGDTPKLARKLEQYEARGFLVAYDHEPFDDVDWSVLHDGLGRRPARRDLLASLVPAETTTARIRDLATTCATLTSRMPPHAIYLSKFLAYLKRKHA